MYFTNESIYISLLFQFCIFCKLSVSDWIKQTKPKQYEISNPLVRWSNFIVTLLDVTELLLFSMMQKGFFRIVIVFK